MRWCVHGAATILGKIKRENRSDAIDEEDKSKNIKRSGTKSIYISPTGEKNQ